MSCRRLRKVLVLCIVLLHIYLLWIYFSYHRDAKKRPWKPISHTKPDRHRHRFVFPRTNTTTCLNARPFLTKFEFRSNSGIPLIIHQIYKDTDIPEQYVQLMQGCRRLNKEFLHILWTDGDFEKFLRTERSDRMAMYGNYKSPDQRSDFMRLVILEHFGGVYMDLDVECRKPLVQTLDALNKTCIIDRERELQTRLTWDRDFNAMNSVMIATPRHKFIRYLLEKLSGALHNQPAIRRTGPIFLTDRFLEFNRTRRPPSDAVYLAPASMFSPLLDSTMLQVYTRNCQGDLRRKSAFCRKGCDEWRRQGQKQDEAKTIADAVLVHRFLHLVYSFARGNIKKRLDACRLVQNITRYVIP